MPIRSLYQRVLNSATSSLLKMDLSVLSLNLSRLNLVWCTDQLKYELLIPWLYKNIQRILNEYIVKG